MPDSRSRRILCVDDQSENLKLLREALEKESYSVNTASSGPEAVEKINQWMPDLVLLDRNMPGLSGLEVLRQLRQKRNYTAVIFLSADSRPTMVSECLLEGADDYIRKPFSFVELIARVEVRFRFKDLQEEKNEAIFQLQEQAERDHLTGLFNMRSMYDKIDFELKRVKRYGGQIACIMMDMDFFKRVNDEHDHLFGSYVLKEVGQIIKGNIRDTDLAARYGGDEYLIVLTQTNADGVRNLCERIRQKIESTNFRSGSDSINLTASLGYCIVGNETKLDARKQVRNADHALYEAKGKGRNRVIGFSST
ncbi:MAG: diguanylate cyclase [Pseudomonadota bacterium]|nr:diguanylate cyclase [Pseudomonadota bacterium]